MVWGKSVGQRADREARLITTDTLVTGRQIDPARATWAAPREAEPWRQFKADLTITRGREWSKRRFGTPAATGFDRWIGNYGSAPQGWPSEMVY